MVKFHSPGIADQPVCIRISGRLGEKELSYLDELIEVAEIENLRILLDLHAVIALDSAAIRYLFRGEGTRFELACPRFIRHWIEQEIGANCTEQSVRKVRGACS